MISRVYEFSTQFQLKILSLMARDKTMFVTYREVVHPSYFKQNIHIDLCRIIHEHYDREMDRARKKNTDVVPPTTEVLWEEVRKLTNRNKKKAEIIEQYQDCILDIQDIDLSDREYIAESLIEFGRRAAMEKAIWDSVDELESDDPDYGKIEGYVEEAQKVGQDISDLGTDYFGQAEERLSLYAKGEDGVRRVPTGLTGIDKIMKGGLGDGELGVVIAPPNVGKSFALTNIGAGAVMEGFNVAHFTLEMPEEQVSKRYDNRLLNKDFGYLTGNADKALTALMNIQRHIKGELYIKRYSTNECDINTLRSYLTRLHAEKGFRPDLIIVDYADLLTPRRTYEDKRFELESVYLDLRDLGNEYKCPVWTASQTNRGGLDKKVITIADLAEAFNKANIADFMVALCQTSEEKEDRIMRWHVAKQRDGEANITLDGDIEYETANMSVYGADR